MKELEGNVEPKPKFSVLYTTSPVLHVISFFVYFTDVANEFILNAIQNSAELNSYS